MNHSATFRKTFMLLITFNADISPRRYPFFTEKRAAAADHFLYDAFLLRHAAG
jgi:hypothetical protein